MIGVYALLVSASAAAVQPVYWRAGSTGLPSDVQALAAASTGVTTTLYAGTWGNGIYRSTDHGATWITATSGITLPMYVTGGLAVNPVTPTMLFAGDYFGTLSGVGVYGSTDGGNSWTANLRDVGVDALLVHPITPTLVLAGTVEDGLFRSSDNGNLWETSLSVQRVQALAAAPVTPGSIYAGAADDLHISTNSGVSWTLASSLSSTVTSLAVHPVTPTCLYAGTRQHGLWRSTDGGTSWLTETVAGLPDSAWVTSIAIDPISPTTLYAAAWQGRVYRSSNGGASWEDLGYLGTVRDVLIHPDAPSVIYAATSNNSVFRGSTLDHLTMEPVDSPQYVWRTFPITLTARDELGFLLTSAPVGASGAQAVALKWSDQALAETLAAGGFDGTAALTDFTTTITPVSATFTDGVAVVEVSISEEAQGNVITATLPGGPSVSSNPFDVVWAGRVYLPLIRR